MIVSSIASSFDQFLVLLLRKRCLQAVFFVFGPVAQKKDKRDVCTAHCELFHLHIGSPRLFCSVSRSLLWPCSTREFSIGHAIISGSCPSFNHNFKELHLNRGLSKKHCNKRRTESQVAVSTLYSDVQRTHHNDNADFVVMLYVTYVPPHITTRSHNIHPKAFSNSHKI